MHRRIKTLPRHFSALLIATLVLGASNGAQATPSAAGWSDSDLVPSFAEVIGQGAPNRSIEGLTFQQVVTQAKAHAVAKTSDPFGSWIAVETARPELAQAVSVTRADRPAAAANAASATSDFRRAADAKLAEVWKLARRHLSVAKTQFSDAKVKAQALWQRAALSLDVAVARLNGALFGSDPDIDPRPLGIVAKPLTAPPAERVEKITLARVIDAPREIKPLRLVVSSPTEVPATPTIKPRLSEIIEASPEQPAKPIRRTKAVAPARPAKLAALQPPETVARSAAVRERPIQRRRLRPFDAEAHGITVTAGSSADSLARMLQDVSTRPPAAPGFRPVFTSAERTIPFTRFLGSKQGLFAAD